jgi:hypothetical protein
MGDVLQSDLHELGAPVSFKAPCHQGDWPDVLE